MTEPTLEELSLQIEANARVLGLILLMLAGYPFPRELLLDVAEACGVEPVEIDVPRGH